MWQDQNSGTTFIKCCSSWHVNHAPRFRKKKNGSVGIKVFTSRDEYPCHSGAVSVSLSLAFRVVARLNWRGGSSSLPNTCFRKRSDGNVGCFSFRNKKNRVYSQGYESRIYQSKIQSAMYVRKKHSVADTQNKFHVQPGIA